MASQVSRDKNCLSSSSAPCLTPGSAPGGFRRRCGAGVGSAGSQASYLPPLGSHLNLHVPAPARSRTAQSTFSAWKSHKPALNPGDLSLARSLQGHCHTTCATQGKLRPPSPAPPTSLQHKQRPYRLVCRIQPGLGLGPEASVGGFPTVGTNKAIISREAQTRSGKHPSQSPRFRTSSYPWPHPLVEEPDSSIHPREKPPSFLHGVPSSQVSIQVSQALTLPTH